MGHGRGKARDGVLIHVTVGRRAGLGRGQRCESGGTIGDRGGLRAGLCGGYAGLCARAAYAGLADRTGPCGPALSPQRQLAVLSLIHDLVNDASQFIIATHRPILMAYPEAWIYRLGADAIDRVEYEDPEHYQVTHDFLEDRERMLRVLFEREAGDEEN